jgi:DNA replication protein DnaC
MLSNAHKDFRRLKLLPMAECWEQWQANPDNAQRSHEDLVHALIEAQDRTQVNRRVQSVMRQAGLSTDISMEAVRVGAARGLSTSLLSNLRTYTWVRQGQNVVITGPARVGKTYLLAALGREASMQGLTVRLWRTPDLLEAYAAERSKSTSVHFRRRLERADLLALDDFATERASEEQCHWLRRLLDERNRASRATMVASPTAIEDFDGFFVDQTAAEAIYGRLFERCHPIRLKDVPATKNRRQSP